MEKHEDVSLSTTDYVVTILILVVPLGIGVFFAIRDSKRMNRDVYLLGGRQMSMLPVTLSLFVTFQSAVTLIGMPSDVYTFGPMFGALYVGISLAYIVGDFTVVPLMFPLHLTSIFEYLQLRFKSRALRLFATATGMFMTILYMAVVLLSPALALQAAVGIPLWMSIAVAGVIGTVYTAIGGIKSVIWTDALQTIIVFAGLFAVVIQGAIKVGGFSEMLSITSEGGRTNFNHFNPDPRYRHSWWGMVFGGLFLWLTHAFNQSTLQRISAMKTLRDAKLSYLLNIPLSIIYSISLLFVGFVVYAYFAHLRCDPFQNGMISSKNQIVPYFVIHAMQGLPGLAGLYMGTIFSGSLSTLSSGINSLAANTVDDVLKTVLRSWSEHAATIITKFFVCFYGLIVIGLGFLANSLKGPVTQIAVSAIGACGSPVMGMFLLGGSVPWANKYGAFVGCFVGLAFNLWVAIGSQLYGRKPDILPPAPSDMCFNNTRITVHETLVSLQDLSLNYSTITYPPMLNSTPTDMFTEKDERSYGFFLYDMSYEWYGVTGAVISFVAGLSISFISRDKREEINPKFIFPFLRKLWSLHEPEPNEADVSNAKYIKNMEHLGDRIRTVGKKQLFVDIPEATCLMPTSEV